MGFGSSVQNCDQAFPSLSVERKRKKSMPVGMSGRLRIERGKQKKDAMVLGSRQVGASMGVQTIACSCLSMGIG